jgi:hypothetical protein
MVRTTPQISEFSRSYNSFSGVDMKATFANRTIGEIQAISYSITREKAPIYTLGSADPRAFSRGKRGIAGTLIFITFDRHALLEELRDLQFQSDKDDVKPEFRSGQNDLNFQLSGNPPSTPVGGGIASNPAIIQQESDLITVDSDQEVAHPWYSDQIPPFDITLAAANEYGALAVMRIFGVEILNEGYGISIDDLVSEQQMTYIARTLLPWQWVRPNDYFINPPNGQST